MADRRTRCDCGGRLASEQDMEDGAWVTELVCMTGCTRRYHQDGRPIRYAAPVDEDAPAEPEPESNRGRIAVGAHDLTAEDRAALGARMREAREAAGLTIGGVTRLTGIPATSISNAERGEHWAITVDRMDTLAALYGVEAAAITCGLALPSSMAAIRQENARRMRERRRPAEALREPASVQALRDQRRRDSIAHDPQQQRERALARQLLTGAVA